MENENEERQRAPRDQQAALEELERFGRDIERYRAQRQAVGEQFETFIRSFETPPAGPTPLDTRPRRPEVSSAALISASAPAAPPAVLPSTVPAPSASAPVAFDAGGGPEDIATPPAPAAPRVSPHLPEPLDLGAEPPAIVAPASAGRDAVIDGHASATDTDPAVPFEALRAPAARGRSTFWTPALLGGALIVILAGGMLARTSWNRTSESAPPVAATPDAAVAAPAPARAGVVAPITGSELTTIRRVWMRVTVDGERVLEREVPAETKVPLNAEKTIVIRTGDAGAVRLSIRGEARGFLGAEGEVVTRSFAVPPRAPAGR